MPLIQLIGRHMEVAMHQALAQTLSGLIPPASLEPLYSFAGMHFYKTTLPRPLLIKVSKLSQVPGSPELARETGFSSILVHRNLLQLEQHHVLQLNHERYLVIVSQYAGRLLASDMQRRKESGKPYSYTELREIVNQIASALQHMKEQNCAHRSVSSYSIFVKKNQAVLGNFGTIRSLPDLTATSSIQGYTHYSSPTIISADQQRLTEVIHNAYQSDMYSLGITMLEMCIVSSGGDFFSHVLSREEIEGHIGKLSLPLDLQSVLIGMLSVSETERMTSAEVISRLTQPVKAILMMSASSFNSLAVTQSDISVVHRPNCSKCGRRNAKELPCGHGICPRPCKDQLRIGGRRCPACNEKVRKSFFTNDLTSKSCLHCQLL